MVPYDVAEEGGVKRHAFHVADCLREMGDEVTVVAPLSRGPSPPGCRGFSGVVDIAANGASNRMAILTPPWAVRRFFAEADFDLVHVHEPLVPLLPYYALAFTPRAAHVCTFHMYAENEALPSRAARRVLSSVMFPRFERGIAVSGPAGEYAARVWRRPLTVIPNGVPTATFVPSDDDDGATMDERPLRLLFVGHWRDPRKGLPYLLDAFHRLRAGGARLELDVVGGGPSGGAAAPGVTYHGAVTAEPVLAGHYRRCDVFVAPATGQESFGIVLLEAMACGRPIVCSDIPGYRHVVDPAGARLAAPGDAGALADAIGGIVADPARRRAMGAHNRRRAEEYDWDRIAIRVRHEYLQAIAERSRRFVVPATLAGSRT